MLDSVVDAFREGCSPETIREDFDGLTLAHVYGAMAFYLDHQTEMDAYLLRRGEQWAELERGGTRASPDLQARLEGARRAFSLAQQRPRHPPTFLLKFDAGASYPAQDHPAGEEVFVLEGEVNFGNYRMAAGDYLYTPPNEKHAVWTTGGCVLLLSVPKKVVILKRAE
jgi:quercetin dioxygenase-like cupin family protein